MDKELTCLKLHIYIFNVVSHSLLHHMLIAVSVLMRHAQNHHGTTLVHALLQLGYTLPLRQKHNETARNL